MLSSKVFTLKFEKTFPLVVSLVKGHESTRGARDGSFRKIIITCQRGAMLSAKKGQISIHDENLLRETFTREVLW